MNAPVFGLDFGTTNTSLAAVSPDQEVKLASFHAKRGITESFRSILYLEKHEGPGRHRTTVWSGPRAIEAYLEADAKGRLIQSLKSFLSSRGLRSTEIFGRQYKLEELIARIVRGVREEAEKQWGVQIRSIVAGRPVWFVGADSEEDNVFAAARLESALKLAGFEEVRFEYEPVGAAYHYESTLDHQELILIGDFGGGTSDFSLLRVGPGRQGSGHELLGNDGVGVAGDAFDAKIIRYVVAPELGAGSEMRSVDKILPVPQWVYARLERWHHVSFLKTRDILNMLKSVEAQALKPHKISALLYLINEDLGYQLHQAVQSTKVQLSASQEAAFHFDDGDLVIDTSVKRKDFERWIGDELLMIEDCVERILARAGVAPQEVDVVFLTGGSSFVPAVRSIFELRFGTGRIRSGHEFTSVARGLALSAQDRPLASARL
jgi:hypothetical chaperone protein